MLSHLSVKESEIYKAAGSTQEGGSWWESEDPGEQEERGLFTQKKTHFDTFSSKWVLTQTRLFFSVTGVNPLYCKVLNVNGNLSLTHSHFCCFVTSLSPGCKETNWAAAAPGRKTEQREQPADAEKQAGEQEQRGLLPNIDLSVFLNVSLSLLSEEHWMDQSIYGSLFLNWTQ